MQSTCCKSKWNYSSMVGSLVPAEQSHGAGLWALGQGSLMGRSAANQHPCAPPTASPDGHRLRLRKSLSCEGNTDQTTMLFTVVVPTKASPIPSTSAKARTVSSGAIKVRPSLLLSSRQQARTGSGISVCSVPSTPPERRGTPRFSTSQMFPHFSSTCHTEISQNQQTHLPVSESNVISTCCSCVVLLLLTSLLSFIPRTAFIFPVLTSDCFNESFSEDICKILN